MNKVKVLVLAIMMIFTINVSLLCVLIYSATRVVTKGQNMLEAGKSDSGTNTITIQNGEILIIDKCNQ